VRLGVPDYGVIVLLGGTKLGGEFLHGEEMAVGRAGRIVELSQETIQACLIAQRQNNVDAQGLCFGEPADELRLPLKIRFTNMTRH
jgi:hypothetical protein